MKQFFQPFYILNCVILYYKIRFGTYAPKPIEIFLPTLFFYYQMIKMKQKEISQKEKDEISKRVVEAVKQDLTHIQELKSN